MAEAHAPRLRARESEVRGAAGGVSLSNQRLLPSLDVGAQGVRATDNNVTGLLFPQSSLLPISGPVNKTASGAMTYGSAAAATLSWSPFTFGQVGAERREARASLALAEGNESVALLDERTDVSVAYLDLLAFRELATVQRQDLARAEAVLRSVRALTSNGLRPGVDSLLANAEVSRARIDLLYAQRNATNAGRRLGELLGIFGDLPPLDGRRFLTRTPDAMSAGAFAVAAHPRLRPFAARIAVSDARQAATARGVFPRISFLAGLSARGSGISPDGTIDRSLSSGLSFDRSNAALGVMMTLPVSDALFSHVRTSIESARADADRAEMAAEEDHLRAEAAAADANLETALAAAREAPVQLAAGTAGYDQMNSRYSAGLATLADLAQARFVLTRAEVDAVVTRLSAWRAWLDQCAARGDLTPFLASVR
ncbi:MAG: TolC family protein [Gemmatimonadaceae bacterium]